jgi:hypothetical protein
MATWNDLFKQDEFRWTNPHEQVVALVSLQSFRQ